MFDEPYGLMGWRKKRQNNPNTAELVNWANKFVCSSYFQDSYWKDDKYLWEIFWIAMVKVNEQFLKRFTVGMNIRILDRPIFYTKHYKLFTHWSKRTVISVQVLYFFHYICWEFDISCIKLRFQQCTQLCNVHNCEKTCAKALYF